MTTQIEMGVTGIQKQSLLLYASVCVDAVTGPIKISDFILIQLALYQFRMTLCVPNIYTVHFCFAFCMVIYGAMATSDFLCFLS